MGAHNMPRLLDLEPGRDPHAGCEADIRDAMTHVADVQADLKKTNTAVDIALRILAWTGPDDTEQSLRATILLVQQILGAPNTGRADPATVRRLLAELGGDL